MNDIFLFLQPWVGNFLATLLAVLIAFGSFCGVCFGLFYGIHKIAAWHDDCICSKCVRNLTRQKMKEVLLAKKIKARWDMEREVSAYVKEWENTLR